MNKFFKICVLILLPLSCIQKSEAPKTLNSEKYNIISMVIDSIAAHNSPRNLWPVQPPQHKFRKTLTNQDSLKARERTIEYINLFRTIAIDTNEVLYLPDYKTSEKIIENRDRFAALKDYDSTKRINIDIKKINLKKRENIIYFDSITYFNPARHLTKYRSYEGIDYRFNFSKISFNESKSKAMIRYSYRFEDKYPEGGLFMLVKIKGEWQITDGYRFVSY